MIRLTLEGPHGRQERYFTSTFFAILCGLFFSFGDWDTLDLESLTQAELEAEVFAFKR